MSCYLAHLTTGRPYERQPCGTRLAIFSHFLFRVALSGDNIQKR